MYVAIICLDKPGHQAVRQANREAHLAYLKDNAARLRAAGPFTDAAGEAMTGSLLILEVADEAEAHAFAAADPYARAGLFESVEIRPWRWIIGAPQA